MNKTPLLCIFFSWLALTLFEGSKQVFRIMVTLYKNRVGKNCVSLTAGNCFSITLVQVAPFPKHKVIQQEF